MSEILQQGIPFHPARTKAEEDRKLLTCLRGKCEVHRESRVCLEYLQGSDTCAIPNAPNVLSSKSNG